jgi:leader peptidase (prepilin peptidase)/N-methyltransferase
MPLIPLAYFGLQLSVIDFKSHRLPNQLVGQFIAIQALVVGAFSWISSDLARMTDAAVVAVATFAVYLLLYLASRGSLGMGDVKFAFPLGLSIGWFAADYWLASIFVSFSIAGLVSVIGLVTKLINRKSRLAFGPYMFLGTFIGCCLGILLPLS